jgi:hypothetical protein
LRFDFGLLSLAICRLTSVLAFRLSPFAFRLSPFDFCLLTFSEVIMIMRISSLVLAGLALVVSAHAQSAGTLRGEVVDNCGRAVEGAQLRVSDVGRSATSLSTGRFALAGLPAGQYDAELVAEGFATQTIRFEISTGRLTDIGALVVGSANEGSCNYFGLFRDVSTIRTLTTDRPADSNVPSIAFRVTKECPGGCD